MLLKFLKTLPLAAAATLSLLSAPVQADGGLRFCVFDPSGPSGDIYAASKPYLDEVATLAGGPVSFPLYSSEREAEEDFRAGQCDGVLMSSLRAAPFNKFIGSIYAIGSLPRAEDLRTVENLLAKPALDPYMSRGDYEVAGVMPLGPLYVMVHDRSINSIDKAAGKRVAVMEWDHWESALVQSMAAQAVASNISDFAAKFNNGQVDIIVAPALLFRQLELARALGQDGGIFRFPLAQLTATFMIHPGRFPTGFGEHFRAFAPTQFDDSFARVAAAEDAIDSHYWLNLSPSDELRYRQLLADARQQLTKEGYYDPVMMDVLRHVRCKVDPGQAECSSVAMK
jgi:hypothetical protein